MNFEFRFLIGKITADDQNNTREAHSWASRITRNRKYSVFSVQLLWEHRGVKRGRFVLRIVLTCAVVVVAAVLLWPRSRGGFRSIAKPTGTLASGASLTISYLAEPALLFLPLEVPVKYLPNCLARLGDVLLSVRRRTG